MLASQFLSVVMDEGDRPNHETSPTTLEVNGYGDPIRDLGATCKLPDVLLTECTISVARPEDRYSSQVLRRCRFDAYVTPVNLQTAQMVQTRPKIHPVPTIKLLERWKNVEEAPALIQNIEELLQGVEAVYSDEEEQANAQGLYRKLKCSSCQQLFVSKGPATTSCPRCTVQSSPLKGQVGAEVHNAIRGGFQCQACGKVYSQRSVLKKHEAVHSGYRLRCKVCGIDFTQRSSLLRHCKRIHGLANDSDVPPSLVQAAAFRQSPAAGRTPTLSVHRLVDRLSARLAPPL